MKNLWDENEAKSFETDLDLRVYSSNLLGRSDELVLHGGGNTSLKSVAWDQDILFVKGSGWDLVSIKKEGFAPVCLETLKDMAKLETLSDTDMVKQQRAAMLDDKAPNPSVEAILHAIIPFKFVDHTHADAVVTISNCINGVENIKKLYPDFLIVPYVMPGFLLAREIYNMTKDINWQKCEGIILHNHGIFTFDNDPKKSYDKMIDAVNIAEDFLNQNAKLELKDIQKKEFDIKSLKSLIEKEKGYEIFLNINQSNLALNYSTQENLKESASRGVLTPEHIIRTKRSPLILDDPSIKSDNIKIEIENYKKEYLKYFELFSKDEIMLNPAPNYAVIKDFGVVSFGKTQKEANIINDIVTHTMNAILKANMLGGFESISYQDSFEMEYWELEQAKLKK